MNALTVGNPVDDTVQVGPLATKQILDDLEAQVVRTVELGGRILTGGKRLARPGFFYSPTRCRRNALYGRQTRRIAVSC